MKTYIVIILAVLTFAFSSCEKTIDVKLDSGVAQLAVSAFVNSKSGVQVIVLSKTGAYFDNTPSPPATGAAVTITDDKGNTFNFTDYTGNGRYEWVPNSGDTLARAGYTYTLSITYSGEQYKAVSVANPVPKVDSLNIRFGKGNNPTAPDAYYAAFYATDFKGRPDFYWIKGFKNDSLLNPHGINLSEDGSIGGGGTDGLPFIYPVRQFINPNNGYSLGDTASVEIHSISGDLDFFFNQVLTQTRNGGLFATPPANVSTNIKNVNKNSSVKAVGFFNVAMVSSGGIRIK